MTKNQHTSVHSSRTIMFAELAKVMDFGSENGDYHDVLSRNVFNKKSQSGQDKTVKYLKTLYGFDTKNPTFKVFRYFWTIANNTEKPLITFVYAINNDHLLAESIDITRDAVLGERIAVESFEATIETYHPQKYSENTRRSMAQNIASSWKQAGFIEGKVKNIRVQPQISFVVACFAFFLAYLKGDRGDFIWNSTGVKALCLNENQLRALAIECAKRDLIQYQYAGNVTSFSFNNLMNKIGINAV